MSVYMTEEEQLEAIKKWWHKYSNLITIISSIILLAFAGYKYWNWHQDKVKTQASMAYENLMVAFSNQDNPASMAYINQIIKQYRKTVYADAARLVLAKLYVSEDSLDKAKEQLGYITSHSSMPALKQVARIRLARILISEKNYDKALHELSYLDDAGYRPVINELKGDVFAANGQYQQALQSYKEAIAEVRTNGMGNLFLEMKTNELASLSQLLNDNQKLQSA